MFRSIERGDGISPSDLDRMEKAIVMLMEEAIEHEVRHQLEKHQ